MDKKVKFFLDISVLLTGFEEEELLKTGMLESYFQIFNNTYPLKIDTNKVCIDLLSECNTDYESTAMMLMEDKKKSECEQRQHDETLKNKICSYYKKKGKSNLEKNICAAYDLQFDPDIYNTLKVNEYTPYEILQRRIIYMWYTGIWKVKMWKNSPGKFDEEFFINKNSYSESLIWQTFHSHPPGHKQAGFGSWAIKPLTVKEDGKN